MTESIPVAIDALKAKVATIPAFSGVIQRDGAPGSLADQLDVVGMVDPRQLLPRRRARLADVAATSSPVGRDDLHDLGALDSLGMAGRIQVIGETVGCEDGHAHGSNNAPA